MAEAETSAPVAEQAQPAPVLTSMDGLDAAMASAKATAVAESTDSTSALERSPAIAASEPATSAQPAADAALEGDDEGETPAAPGQPAKPSRMGRLHEQLTAAEQRTRDAEAQLQQRMAQDAQVADKYRGLLGTPEERARLNAVMASPTTPASELNQARARIAQMNQAGQELSPLRAEVEASVLQHFTRGMETLRTLDGMDEQAHQSLFKAPSGVEALKLMHGIGAKAAEEKFKGEVADLKQQLKDTKRQLAAGGSQPARAGGLAPNGSTALAGLLGADGLPTEEAIAMARRGELRTRFATNGAT